MVTVSGSRFFRFVIFSILFIILGHWLWLWWLSEFSSKVVFAFLHHFLRVESVVQMEQLLTAEGASSIFVIFIPFCNTNGYKEKGQADGMVVVATGDLDGFPSNIVIRECLLANWAFCGDF